MISASDVVNTARIPLRERAGYIWGMSGVVWTEALQKQYAPKRDTTRKYGSRWIGRRVWDCSGLWLWIYKLYGEKIYHGSNTIWREYCSAKGKIVNGKKENGEALLPGSAVFLYRKSDNCRHHIGVYVGGGQCIEAKGTAYGVVLSDIDHWDEWGELRAVDYSGKVVIDTATSLRLGCRGEAVEKLQNDLHQLGYDPGKVDGIYGANTKQAVSLFQIDMGLDCDGIAGDQTLDRIEQLLRGEQPPAPAPEAPDMSKQLGELADLLRQAIRIIEQLEALSS